jgi:hypothetical protein
MRPQSGGQKKQCHTGVVTTVTPETPGIPRTMVYSLLRALPGEPGFFATVISGIPSTDLDTSVGVSGPHDFAVRLRHLRLGTIRVHRIPTPRS